MTQEILIGGHRGLGATDSENAQKWRDSQNITPENTPESFMGAFEAGADFIEFDAVPAKDGLVVMHNANLVDHMFPPPEGAKHTRDLTVTELIKLNVGHRRAAQDTVPSFEQVLLTVKPYLLDGSGRFINVELKEVQGSGLVFCDEDSLPFGKSVHDLVIKHGLLPHTLFSSFNVENLDALKGYNPKARIAMLFGTSQEDRGEILHSYPDEQHYWGFTPTNVHETLDELSAEALHPPLQSFANGGPAPAAVSAAISWAKRNGKPLPAVNVWALNEEPVERFLPLWEKAHDLLVGFNIGFITDYPAELRAALTQRGRMKPPTLSVVK